MPPEILKGKPIAGRFCRTLPAKHFVQIIMIVLMTVQKADDFGDYAALKLTHPTL
jgi:hypothetical protein